MGLLFALGMRGDLHTMNNKLKEGGISPYSTTYFQTQYAFHTEFEL
jgi:hypothetical protein